MEGQVFGQYLVTGVLGEGGMGIVYAAEHTLLDRPAAVKVLHPKLSGEQEIVTRFFNEARAATAIRHPGIVEIYDFGWTDDRSAFVVMEYLQGETLSARCKRGPMRWSTALVLARQIAGALGAAHAKDIVHRDLKPDNIFLVPDPEVPGGRRIKLLDFGIAKLAGAVSSHHKTPTGVIMGTPTYMAPEQCRGIAVDARADLYSLGCILFELCTGRPPFIGEGAGDIYSAHIHDPPPSISSLASNVPYEIESLIQRLLAKAPANRVQTADDLILLIDAARTEISQVASVDHKPVADEEATSTLSERTSAPDYQRDSVVPTPVTEDEATTPIVQVRSPPLRFDTTLSSAIGMLAQPPAPPPERRLAVLSAGLALSLIVAFGALLAYKRGAFEADGDSPSIQAAAPSSNAEPSPPPTVAAQAPIVTPPPIENTPPPSAPLPAPDPPTPSSPTLPPPTAPGDPTVAAPSTAPIPTAPTTAERHSDAGSSSRSQQPAARIQVRIESNPSGARVMINDQDVGKTPWVRQLERGDEMVRVVLQRAGYQDYVIYIPRVKGGTRKVTLVKSPLESVPEDDGPVTRPESASPSESASPPEPASPLESSQSPS